MGPLAGKKNQDVSQRTPIRLEAGPPTLAGLDMTRRVGRKKYERKLAKLQDQLREVSLAYRAQHRRAVIVFEGWDAAGEGRHDPGHGLAPGSARAVPGNDKRHGRLVAMKAILERLTDGVDTTPHSLDSEFEGKARKILGGDASG